MKISVTDQGCGIFPDTLKLIFDPFFSTRFIGRGLGLPTVLGIVRSHNGGVAVESTPEVGSTFHVMLPFPKGEPISIKPVEQQDVGWAGGGCWKARSCSALWMDPGTGGKSMSCNARFPASAFRMGCGASEDGT